MSKKNIKANIQSRADTASNWKTENPVLLKGEIGIESDTRLIKVGNGLSSWNVLPYVEGSAGDGTTVTTLAETLVQTLDIIDSLQKRLNNLRLFDGYWACLGTDNDGKPALYLVD